MGELVGMAVRLDTIGQYDLADRVDRVMLANTLPGTQPSMQLLPPEMTMMRGVAGKPISDAMQAEEAEDGPKQVIEQPRRKRGPKVPGVSIGTDVMLTTRDTDQGAGTKG
jgi:hypothetical protein